MNSGACLGPNFFDSEPKIHLTVEELQLNLNKLCAEGQNLNSQTLILTHLVLAVIV